MKVYDFTKQFKIGKKGEAYLDEVFDQFFEIRKVSREYEQRGIDRIFVDPATLAQYTVEYKTDVKAGETGNVFIETVSVDKDSIKGWALSSEAQLIIIYVPTKAINTIYAVNAVTIKESIAEWKAEYGEKKVRNKHYFARGVAVPLDVFKTVCESVLIIRND